MDLPIVFKSSKDDDWSCLSWSLTEWSQVLEGVRLPFRVHKKKSTTSDGEDDVKNISKKRRLTDRKSDIEWENEAVDKFTATFDDFLVWESAGGQRPPGDSPFSKFNRRSHWAYSSYNYLTQLEGPKMDELLQSIKWEQVNFHDKVTLTKGVEDGRDSVLWIGSPGAFTPCHQDTYGFNLVRQVRGKKLWLLFPPSDVTAMSPTRIPYEESSIFSRINFLQLLMDDKSSSHADDLRPYVVVLEAGETLYVPHMWWHFVLCLGPEVAISINTWQPLAHEPSVGHVEEALVKLLVATLFPVTSGSGTQKWFNETEDDPPNASESLSLLKGCLRLLEGRQRHPGTPASLVVSSSSGDDDRGKDFSVVTERMTLTEVGGRKLLPKDLSLPDADPEESDLKRHSSSSFSHEDEDDHRRLNIERMMMECILHPEVVSLIVRKMVSRLDEGR